VIIFKRYFSQADFSIDKIASFGIVDPTILIIFLSKRGMDVNVSRSFRAKKMGRIEASFEIIG